MPNLSTIPAHDLRDAWRSLATHGTPPAPEIARGVLPAWSVHLDDWLDRLTRLYLRDHCLRNSHFKLAIAPNGGGKTHFCLALAARAAGEGWAVCYLACKAGVNLADWFTLYEHIARAIELPGATRHGIKPLAQAALDRMRQDAENAPVPDAALDEMITALEDEDWAHHSFARVMAALLRHLRDPRANPELGAAALRWLEGQPASLTAKERQALRLQNVAASARAEHGRTLFASLVKFIPRAGVNGLVLLLDEMETMLNQTGRALERILVAMRVMLDAPDSRTDRIPLFGLFTAVPGIDQQIGRYPAIEQRFRVMIPFHEGDDNAPRLELSHLGAQHEMLRAIGEKLLVLGLQAHGWNFDRALQTRNLRALADATGQRNLEVNARRIFVKAWCSLLEQQARDGEREYSGEALGDFVQGVYQALRQEDAGTGSGDIG